ncbi:transcription factor HY5-like isoform X2 [Punica granatum]|uniref:Transcription factor HY5-like isoform X2 n=1 Tax=Punica granatum TaxID=22663 RepID=A0A6P8CBV9_PUNGR|nr:transcription factor HY5-like isoform X2 [Punica granatum]
MSSAVQQIQVAEAAETMVGSSASSSWKRLQAGAKNTAGSIPKKSKIEMDEDLFTVPDVEARPSAAATATTNSTTLPQQMGPDGQGKRRRGRNPVDKEYKRLKRLLRNRVSAQQARERKKVYMNHLEARAGELQENNSKLEEKISTLINENTMLRKILMNTRPKADENTEPKQ